MATINFKSGNINDSLDALDYLIDEIKSKYSIPPVVIMDEYDKIV